MSTVTRPAASIEYVKVRWRASVVLDDQTVEIAVVVGAADEDDFNAATWLTTAKKWRTAGILAGPGTDLVLTAGSYTVWTRLTDNPEIPIVNAGTLILT